MIIKTGGISSGNGARITTYAVTQAVNERIDVLQEENDQLLVCDEFAAAKGRKNGLLHIIICPEQALTANELRRTMEAIREEFGYNPADPETLAMHESRRADGSLQKHYHLVRPAADTSTGKTYRLFRSKNKDEAVSRLCELEFGHKLTSGAHNQFAAMRLREQGRDDLAAQLAEAFGGEGRPQAAYNHIDHQQAKRHNFDLPAFRQHLKELAELDRSKQPKKLAELILRDGLGLAPAVTQGRGRSRIMIRTRQGVKDHNANRTLKIKASEVAAFIEETQLHLRAIRLEKTATRTVSPPHSNTENNQKEQYNAERNDRLNLPDDQQTNRAFRKQSADANSDQQYAETTGQADRHSQSTSQVSAPSHERSEAESSAIIEAVGSKKVQAALNQMTSTPLGGGAISSGVEPMVPTDLSKPGAATRALLMWSRMMQRLLHKQKEQEEAARRGYSLPSPSPKPPWG